MYGNRCVKLSSPAGRFGISCDANGAFIDDIPLLRKLETDEGSVWTSRPVSELSDEVGSRHDLPIDLSSRVGGLDAIARAFNAGDVALAQIATVLLAIPERPRLSKGVRSQEAWELFIRELYSSRLIKADWNPDEHPRWPAGSPDSQGGEFAPKNEALPDANAAGDDSGGQASHKPNVDTDFRNAESNPVLSDAAFDGRSDDAALAPAVERGEDQALFDPVVYRGEFHDEVVEGLARHYRNHGYKVETEVSLEMADGSGVARIDMLVESPEGLISGLEAKTGDDPFFTRAQLYVYPHLILGLSVITPDRKIRTLGLPPMTLLPPIPPMLFYLQDANSDQEMKWQDPWKLLQEYKRRFGVGGARKFERELLSKRGASKMSDGEGEDISIIAHGYGGRVLASREVALAMAEMPIKEARGEEYLKTQLPLQAIDGGDLWIIGGSRKGEDYPPGPTGLPEGKFVVKIRKRNCQVLGFAGT